tara:strand:+ start:33022 stop:34170 length:1149 start_codon:yes stop_codon:yes gene_type:complete
MKTLQSWSFPTQIYFGCGAIQKLPEICKQYNIKRPLLVTDPFLANNIITQNLIPDLEQNNIIVSVFSDVKSNPTDTQAFKGKMQFLEKKCDGVIALGGGSPLDAGKAIALLINHTFALSELEDIDDNYKKATNSIPPIIAIPTTAGTGSEVGRAAVLHDTEQNRKIILFHPDLLPKVVLADPNLTLALPPTLTAATGMDALSHCLEAYCSPSFHPSAEGIALEGMRQIKNNLMTTYQYGQNIEARSGMLVASQMGAIAFQKGLGGMHALSHAIGALHDYHHGLLNAILMPYVLKFNRPVLVEKLSRLENFLGFESNQGQSILTWVLDLKEQLNIPNTLSELGMVHSDDPELIKLALQDPSCAGNPVPLDQYNLKLILAEALG